MSSAGSLAGGLDDLEDVGLDRLGDLDLGGQVDHLQDLLGVAHRLERLDLEAAGVAAHDQALGLEVRVAHRQLEQEAVELGLGQRERAGQLDRVLRGQHEERVRAAVGRALDGDVALGHRLEQRRLRLRRGPVDLVDEQDVGEHRAGLEDERPSSCVSMIDDPVMSPGSMSGVHWMRLTSRRSSTADRARASIDLPTPGTSSNSTWPFGADGDQREADDVLLAVDDGVDVVGDPCRTASLNRLTSMGLVFFRVGVGSGELAGAVR